MDVYYLRDGRHFQTDSANGQYIYYDGVKYCNYRRYKDMMRDVLRGGK